MGALVSGICHDYNDSGADDGDEKELGGGEIKDIGDGKEVGDGGGDNDDDDDDVDEEGEKLFSYHPSTHNRQHNGESLKMY